MTYFDTGLPSLLLELEEYDSLSLLLLEPELSEPLLERETRLLLTDAANAAATTSFLRSVSRLLLERPY